MGGQATFVTTSWDDGDSADRKLAELLHSKGIRGTFYVPIHYRDRSLEHSELRTLASAGFEIGAHGLSHRPLCGLPPHSLARDVQSCKQVLEDVLGTQVEMFCYPRGRYDANVVRGLREAGYRGARTVRMLRTNPAFEPFEMPTTLQAFPHAPFTYLKNVARAPSFEGLQSLLVRLPLVRSWLELGKRLFDSVVENGGVWHLIGHSREIEELGLWNDLREMLDYVSQRDGVSYVPNGALLPPRPSPRGVRGGVATGNSGDMNRAAIPDMRTADPPFRELQG